MSGERDRSFLKLVQDAVSDTLTATSAVSMHSAEFDAKKLAEAILARLHEAGLAIHDPEWCVRIPWQDRKPLGRAMSLDEAIALGLVAVGDPP